MLKLQHKYSPQILERYLHNALLNVNSTIFKTITSSVDESRKTLALFNKDWNTYKTNWQNANGIGGKIGSIFASSNANTSASVISNDQVQILRNWNNAVKHGCTDQATFNRIISNADENTKMYFAGLNKGKGSIEGLKNAQNIATQSTIGLTIAQTALNMAITMGITALASLIMKGYDELANSVENCKERVDDLMSSYKSALDTANNNANRVEELADKYEDLSKGVNSLGENVSLTNEEYQEYNSLVNEIAEMFPTLIQGYTDEGNAILNLKGNVEQLREVYKGAQQEAYNLLILSGKDSDGNDIIKQWEDTHDTGFWSDMLDLGADDVGVGISVSDALKQLRAIQQMSADEYREIERITGSGSRKEIAGLTDIEKEIGYGSYLYKALGLDSNSTDEEFRNAQKQAKALIQTYNSEIESALSDVETLANAYLMTNEDYDKLDTQSKTAASMIVNSLNADIANKFSSKEDVATYVDEIVQSLSGNEDVHKALVKLFTMDTTDMSINEVQQKVDEYVGTVSTELDEDPIELKARFGFDNSDTEPLVNKVKGFLNDEFDDKVEELTLEKLDTASKLEIPEGTLLSWDELLAKIKEVQSSTLDDETPDLWDYSETISQLDTIKEKFDVLDNAFAKLHDADKSTQIGFDDFSSINEAFKDLDGIDTYIQRLQEAGQNQEQVTSVMQDLISAYLDYSNVLDNITDENKDLVVSMLEELGVANALDVVNAKLSGSLFSVADAENLVVQYGYSLIQITTDEINGLVLEGAISEQTAQQLAILALQKQLTNDAKIETEEEVNRIYNLAKMAGIGAEALAKFAQFKNDLENTTDARTRSWIIKSINTYKSTLFKEIDGVKTNEDIFTPVKYTGGKATKSAASSAKKEAKKTMEDIQKDWKEYLDKYLALYKAELDAGLIDFQTFLNKSRSLLDEFYRDGKISAKDYWDSVGNLYQQQLDVYDKVISAITKRIDKEIDGIQGIIDGLEKQNDVLQNQLDEYDGILKVVDDVYQTEIDSIKQKQDAIDDTISKLQDENDEKQRAIDLEKARYQLYRALNNRNVKLYNGKEYIYTHDREEVRDAQQNLADLELQETVAGLEKEKNALDEVIAELEKYRDLWAEISSAKQNEEYKQLAIAIWGKDYEKLILSNRISDIESFKDNYIHIQQQIEDNQGLIDSYNEKIEYYDALKQAWNAIATEREETVNREMAAQVLGATWENDILNGRMEVLNNFRNQYLATQQAIVDAAWNAANAQIAALNAIKSAESTSSQTSSSSKAPTVSGNKNTPTKKPSKPSKPNANSGGGISNLPTIEKYGSGTDNAKPGWHEVAESGNEIIRDNNGNAYIAKGRQIHLFEGGETVYSASDTRELLSGSISPLDAGIGEVVVFDHDKMRKNLQQLIPDYMNTMPSMINIPRYNVDNVRSGNPININIGDINLHEVQSVDGLAKAIIRELPGKVNQAMYRK